MDLVTFLLDRVAIDEHTGCWEWQGARCSDGYGTFNWHTAKRAGISSKAHRALYQLIVGPVAQGLDLDHLCRNRGCVSPDHLEPVTHAENMRRGFFANKTHCPTGHPYNEANTYEGTTREGYRKRCCRSCNADAARRYRARKAS